MGCLIIERDDGVSIKPKTSRWIVLLACALLLGGCGNSAAAKPVIGRLWTLERFSALGEESPEPPEEPPLVELVFADDRTFTLSDRTSQQEWRGTYRAEKVYDFYEKGGVSCRLELDFADSPTPVIGSYGTRYYYDGTQLPSLLLSSEDWVCSFLAYE